MTALFAAEAKRLRLEQLMSRYVEGDDQVFDELYGLAAPRLLNIVARMTQDRQRAEDIVQMTFLKLHRKKQQYRSGSPVMPWLTVIARRTLLDESRSLRHRRESLSEDGIVDQAHDGVDLGHLERRAQVRLALEQLPSQYREAIELTKLDGLSGNEAADLLNTTRAAIKQRVHRGYEMLRRVLSGSADPSSVGGAMAGAH
jgi:RNA polymerase sigma-70 factor, ECF subfamily